MGEDEEETEEVGANEQEEEKGDSESLMCSPCGPEEENKGKDDEARKPRIPRRPNAPTKAEIEEHEITHLPPRDWCPHCVAGHGISNQHSVKGNR